MFLVSTKIIINLVGFRHWKFELWLIIDILALTSFYSRYIRNKLRSTKSAISLKNNLGGPLNLLMVRVLRDLDCRISFIVFRREWSDL